jgi:putative glutathione S-transferase
LHIKQHYCASHETINPTRIVPNGPDVDYNAPHGRDHLAA